MDSLQRAGWGNWMKECEGISQRTYMHDLWTWTVIKGWPEVEGWVELGKRGKSGTTLIA